MDAKSKIYLKQQLDVLSKHTRKALFDILNEVISSLELSEHKYIEIPIAPQKYKIYEYIVNILLRKNIDFNNSWVLPGSHILPFRIDIEDQDFNTLVFIQELISENLPILAEKDREAKIILNSKTGEVTYISKTGKKYHKNMKIGKNEFLLLRRLAQSPFEIISFSDLGKSLNEPKHFSDSPSNERRVRDTIKSIKDGLYLEGIDRVSLFTVNSGLSLNCTVETVN